MWPTAPCSRGWNAICSGLGRTTTATGRSLDEAAAQLRQAGFTVHPLLQQGHADDVIAAYVRAQNMDLLIMGAYGHSHIRTLIIGSTTSSMLRSCPISVLMFR